MNGSRSRRLAVFASGEFGRQVAHLVAQHAPAVCLVLDDADRDGVNGAIIATHPATTKVLLASQVARDGGRALAETEPGLGVLAWWPHIVPRSVIDLAVDGFVNLHPSLLPHQRGRDPYFWALVEDTPYGVTIHRVDDGVDTGDVLVQQVIDVAWPDTAETLYHRSREALIELFATTLPRLLTGDITGRPQGPTDPAPHRRAELEPASQLVLDEPSTPRQLLNLLRARTFPPHPGAWFEHAGRRYEVRVEVRDAGPASGTKSG